MPDTKYSEQDKDYMKKASMLCDNANCGYKTGCVIVKGGEVITEAWNERLPGNTFCNYGTCIREEENLRGGKDIHKVCSIHAEVNAISKAVKKGIVLEGSTLYVTTFPCLICAKSIAQAGISKIFYMTSYMGEDYSSDIFKAMGIDIIQIPMSEFWGTEEVNR